MAGVILTAVIGIILTSPALITVDVNGVPSPVAFTAVVSIGVIGLYWSLLHPDLAPAADGLGLPTR